MDFFELLMKTETGGFVVSLAIMYDIILYDSYCLEPKFTWQYIIIHTY